MMKRRKLIAMLACGAAVVGMAACGKAEQPAETSEATKEETTTSESDIKTASSPKEAKELLEEGNKAFVKGKLTINATDADRQYLAENGQSPYAVVLTCSDSRVSPELVFNTGLGETFDIRTAGNVVDSYEVGSVEYAVDHLSTPLVVVMGHTSCGAVAGAIEGHAEGEVEDIIEAISSSVEKAKKETSNEEEVAKLAEKYNVENSIAKLRESKILSEAEKDGKIQIVGAIYDISTGKVEFL